MSTVQVGRYLLDINTAEAMIAEYCGVDIQSRTKITRTKKTDFYSWPYYDGMNTGSGPYEMNEGDLLSPVLLNVNPKIHGFASLQKIRKDLEQFLVTIPPQLSLADASDSEIEKVAQIYRVLTEQKLLGVGGTTLSKVLHRKRPHLIPLHDKYVYGAYVPKRLARSKNRSWEEYMTLFMREMRQDLR